MIRLIRRDQRQPETLDQNDWNGTRTEWLEFEKYLQNITKQDETYSDLFCFF